MWSGLVIANSALAPVCSPPLDVAPEDAASVVDSGELVVSLLLMGSDAVSDVGAELEEVDAVVDGDGGVTVGVTAGAVGGVPGVLPEGGTTGGLADVDEGLLPVGSLVVAGVVLDGTVPAPSVWPQATVIKVNAARQARPGRRVA